MQKRVFIDSDVILDVLLARDPFAINSAKVLNLCEISQIQGFTSTTTLLNTAYVLGKSKMTAVRAPLLLIRDLIQVLSITPEDINYGLLSDFLDFEDSVQSSVALNANLEFIITRNVKDYITSEVKAITPEQFLNLFDLA